MYESFLAICIANIFYYMVFLFSLLTTYSDEHKNGLIPIYPSFPYGY